ncbi:MAG: hypothetical protein ABI687_08540 [Flavitalea sp.]
MKNHFYAAMAVLLFFFQHASAASALPDVFSLNASSVKATDPHPKAGACPTAVYRSTDPLLKKIKFTQSLPEADENAVVDLGTWSGRKKVADLLAKFPSKFSFNGQLLLKVDCNGTIISARFIQQSDKDIAAKLAAAITGAQLSSAAKKDRQPVSSYEVVNVLYSSGRLQRNPIF